MYGMREMKVGGGWLELARERLGVRFAVLLGPGREKENVKLEFEEPAAGAGWPGVEEVMELVRYWKGRRMLIRAQSAWVAGSCWAWSRKKRWHDWYAGCHSRMSKVGSPAIEGGAWGGCSGSLL